MGGCERACRFINERWNSHAPLATVNVVTTKATTTIFPVRMGDQRRPCCVPGPPRRDESFVKSKLSRPCTCARMSAISSSQD